MEERQRPTAEVDNNVGKQRYERYKSVIDQYNKAMEQGFYLEATTIMESLIADRLESLANYVAQKLEGLDSNFSYATLERLTEFLNGKNQQPYLSEDLRKTIQDIIEWKEQRNRALHEIAKLDDKEEIDFADLYEAAKATAERGLELFKEINKQTRKKQSQNK